MILPLVAEAPTAGGAAVADILRALALSSGFFLFTGWIIVQERIRGRRTALGRGIDWLSAKAGMPGWAGLPAAVLPLFLLLAGWGVYWDTPLHMQKGRDDGAFANPSHYPIFIALIALLNIALLIMAMAKDPLPRHTLRLAPNWRVPFSSVVLFLAGFVAVVGFPLDDVWHRIFGQDVTEWGPTHVLMIGGAITAPWCVPLLLSEAKQVGAPLLEGKLGRWIYAAIFGFCTVPFAFLMEFDLGVPQFPASTQGIIYSFTLAFCCIAARLWFGRGGALVVSGVWIFAHVFLVVTVAPLPGVLLIQWLTSVPFAVVVELVALAFLIERKPARLPLFAVVAGALGGSVGYYLEWLWSKQHMALPQPFNDHVLPYLLVTSTLAGIAGGLIAPWWVRRLQAVADPDGTHPQGPGSAIAVPVATYRWFGLAGFLAFVAIMAVAAPPMKGELRTAVVTYDHVSTGGSACTTATVHCVANATVTFQGEDPVPDATWFYALAWQGNPHNGTEKTADIPADPDAHVPGLVRTRMVSTGEPGAYRSEDPLPLYGEWKTLLRLHEGTHDMMSFALYMPDDPAITSDRGREIRVANGATIQTAYEPHLLQRERKDSIPEGLYAAGNYLVLSLWVLVLLGFGACYNAAAGIGRRTPSVREKVDA